MSVNTGDVVMVRETSPIVREVGIDEERLGVMVDLLVPYLPRYYGWLAYAVSPTRHVP